jgi:hypothetical protein
MGRLITNPVTAERYAIKDQLITEMLWEDVPAKQVGNVAPLNYPRMDSFVAALKANPGKTARFPEPFYGHPVANIKKRHPEIEWVSRLTDSEKSTYALWGTYKED